jgi:hypothetical protein
MTTRSRAEWANRQQLYLSVGIPALWVRFLMRLGDISIRNLVERTRSTGRVNSGPSGAKR